MAQPSFIGSGTTPMTGDTRRFLLCKLLGALQNGLGGSAIAYNNPLPDDTIYRLRVKILGARGGRAGGFGGPATTSPMALPSPPPSVSYLTDENGNYILDSDGNRIVVSI